MKPLWILPLCGVLLIAGCDSEPDTTTPVAEVEVSGGENATPTPTPRPIVGYVRALHAVPEAGTVSLVADGEKFASIDYGSTSSFAGMRDSRVEISAFGSDGEKISGPMPLPLKKGDDVTVLVTGVPGDVVLIPWEHKDRAPVADQAKIAFVHSAKALPEIDIQIDGKSFRRNVEFGIATDYTTLAPGAHTFALSYDRSLEGIVLEKSAPTVVTKDAQGNTLSVEQPPPSRTVVPRREIVTASQSADLEAGKVYSVAVFHTVGQQPQIKIIEDTLSAAPVPEG